MKLMDVIKYEGGNDTIIWKHPNEDFNSGTQLIVHQSQEAIFFHNGQALDSFGPGRHTLETQNLPLLEKRFRRPSKETPFHAEVYFVNLVELRGIQWGTSTRAEYTDPVYNFLVALGVSGSMSLKVENPRKLLLTLVGTETELKRDKLQDLFKDILDARVKNYLIDTIVTEEMDIFRIEQNLITLSDAIKVNLNNDYQHNGVELIEFTISRALKPVNDPTYIRHLRLFNKQLDIEELEHKKALAEKSAQVKEVEILRAAQIKAEAEALQLQRKAEAEAYQKTIDAQAEAQKRQMEGYTYQDERLFDVQEKLVQNEGVGDLTSMASGIGLMGAAGAVAGGVMGQMNQGMQEAGALATQNAGATKFCSNCGAGVKDTDKFCSNCGQEQVKQKNACTNCGEELADGAKFCSNCGHQNQGD